MFDSLLCNLRNKVTYLLLQPMVGIESEVVYISERTYATDTRLGIGEERCESRSLLRANRNWGPCQWAVTEVWFLFLLLREHPPKDSECLIVHNNCLMLHAYHPTKNKGEFDILEG